MQYLFHRILVTLIGLVIVCNANAHLNPRASIKYQLYIAHFESIMGTSMEMKVKASSSSDAEKAEQKALTEIKRLSLILSAYDKNSEFSKWMATKNEAIKVSSELYTILSLFDQWKQKTNGALNASAEGINQIWKQGALKQQCPSVAEITKAVNEASIKHWQLNPEKNTAIHLSNAPLMLNTFVKSYIIQSAVDKAMKTNDIKAVVLNIGGDIVVAGDINEEIVVTDPKAAAINDAYLENLIIANKAIATSGNYQRGTMINGEWYSHIVDP